MMQGSPRLGPDTFDLAAHGRFQVVAKYGQQLAFDYEFAVDAVWLSLAVAAFLCAHLAVYPSGRKHILVSGRLLRRLPAAALRAPYAGYRWVFLPDEQRQLLCAWFEGSVVGLVGYCACRLEHRASENCLGRATQARRDMSKGARTVLWYVLDFFF